MDPIYSGNRLVMSPQPSAMVHSAHCTLSIIAALATNIGISSLDPLRIFKKLGYVWLADDGAAGGVADARL